MQLHEFLSFNPKLRIAEFCDECVVLEGEYDFKAQMRGYEVIAKTFSLKVIFPRAYPRKLPSVIDTSDFFPRDSKYHTYKDGSFCLGSDLKIKSILFRDQTASAFFRKIVDPFLYAVTYRITHNEFPFGELEHGEDGLIDDYEKLFEVKGKASVLKALEALGKRKREANKLACPCNCGLRLGRCDYRFFINKFRDIDRRRWFRSHLVERFTPMEKPKKKTCKAMKSAKKQMR